MKRILCLAIVASGVLGAQTPGELEAALKSESKDILAQLQATRTQVQELALQIRQTPFDSHTLDFVSGVVNGPTVKGAPYSGEAVTESVQVLSDGNRIEQKTSSKHFRDSEGRERREESSNMNAVFITDPVARTSYTLHPDTKTIEKGPPALTFRYAAGNPAGDVTTLTFKRLGIASAGDPTPAVPAGFDWITGQNMKFFTTPSGGNELKLEDLGTRSIEGVPATGSRTTLTIPAGQIGNLRPIEIVDESWYSPDLKMTVMTRHSDPRSGQTLYKLTNIQRLDPPRSLFEVPADYTLSDRTKKPVIIHQPVPQTRTVPRTRN